MPFEDLSKDELISILELIEKAQRTNCALDMQRLILSAAGIMQAEYAACGMVRTGPDGATAVLSYVNGNYPAEWVKRYLARGYHLKDPVVRFHARFAYTQTWSDVFRRFDDPAARQVVSEADDFGLRFGITGALYLPETDSVAMFSFAGGKDIFGAHHKALSDVLSLHLAGPMARCAGGLLDNAGRDDADGYPTQLEGKSC